jgi:hypothetical protein
MSDFRIPDDYYWKAMRAETIRESDALWRWSAAVLALAVVVAMLAFAGTETQVASNGNAPPAMSAPANTP